MSTATDLNAATIIANLQAGAYPRETIDTIARGFLPLPQEDLIAVLAYLIASNDAEIAELAAASLHDIPSRIVHAFASHETATADHLELLVRASRDRTILEALIRNRVVSDNAIAELARRADPSVQEVIVINQARIIRSRHILDELLQNPQLSPDARRRALSRAERNSR